MKISPLKTGILLLSALALSVQPASAHPGHEEPLPESFSRSTPAISYYSTPNRKHTEIKGGEATVLGKVSFDLAKASTVLVQFNSGLATVTPEGCPCSVRTSLKVDDQEPVVIKRVNLGAVNASVAGKYQVDRQSADGSFVLSLPAGQHEIALVVQRIEGSSALLHAFYANIQAIPFRP
ncbi:hypothetical protein [Novosphingobium sp. AP12]|uniref:hypothetical protein n=1 Tax=Novosphingobium sp. AP12 TaxID=1144305 RepID=UPI00027219FB|nr:hypothetical protein [Novosphingobium sp. AP12]EJL27973.1 hypothetical protein PMI02_02689 [Novosphingobium sp. AP12]